jgi:hypothetical protein
MGGVIYSLASTVLQAIFNFGLVGLYNLVCAFDSGPLWVGRPLDRQIMVLWLPVLSQVLFLIEDILAVKDLQWSCTLGK